MSIKKIAELAEVSVATVSRVINNNGGYSANTEQRVREIIEKYHYKPNLVAKGLRTQKTPIIGMLVPDITNEYYSKLVLQLQTLLFEAGYLTMICNFNESSALQEDYLSSLIAQNVSGVILVSSVGKNIELKGIPAVYVDRRPQEAELMDNTIFVESDNEMGGYLATKNLLDAGCKNIAFLTDMLQESSKVARYQGYCRALEEARIKLDSSLMLKVETVSIDDSFNLMMKFLNRNIEMDGMMCATDILAIGAILALQTCGKKVPEDVKITGYDNITLASLFKPSITTIHQYTDKMASLVSELILALIRNEDIKKHHYSVEVTLMRRKSTE